MTQEERDQLQQAIDEADALEPQDRTIPGAILGSRIAALLPQDARLHAGGTGLVVGMFLPQADVYLPLVDGREDVTAEDPAFANACVRVPGWLVPSVSQHLLLTSAHPPTEEKS